MLSSAYDLDKIGGLYSGLRELAARDIITISDDDTFQVNNPTIFVKACATWFGLAPGDDQYNSVVRELNAHGILDCDNNNHSTTFNGSKLEMKFSFKGALSEYHEVQTIFKLLEETEVKRALQPGPAWSAKVRCKVAEEHQNVASSGKTKLDSILESWTKKTKELLQKAKTTVEGSAYKELDRLQDSSAGDIIQAAGREIRLALNPEEAKFFLGRFADAFIQMKFPSFRDSEETKEKGNKMNIKVESDFEQEAKDVTREKFSINGTLFDEHVQSGSIDTLIVRLRTECLTALRQIYANSEIDENDNNVENVCDDLVQWIISSITRTNHGGDTYFKVAELLDSTVKFKSHIISPYGRNQSQEATTKISISSKGIEVTIFSIFDAKQVMNDGSFPNAWLRVEGIVTVKKDILVKFRDSEEKMNSDEDEILSSSRKSELVLVEEERSLTLYCSSPKDISNHPKHSVLAEIADQLGLNSGTRGVSFYFPDEDRIDGNTASSMLCDIGSSGLRGGQGGCWITNLDSKFDCGILVKEDEETQRFLVQRVLLGSNSDMCGEICVGDEVMSINERHPRSVAYHLEMEKRNGNLIDVEKNSEKLENSELKVRDCGDDFWLSSNTVRASASKLCCVILSGLPGIRFMGNTESEQLKSVCAILSGSGFPSSYLDDIPNSSTGRVLHYNNENRTAIVRLYATEARNRWLAKAQSLAMCGTPLTFVYPRTFQLPDSGTCGRFKKGMRKQITIHSYDDSITLQLKSRGAIGVGSGLMLGGADIAPLSNYMEEAMNLGMSAKEACIAYRKKLRCDQINESGYITARSGKCIAPRGPVRALLYVQIQSINGLNFSVESCFPTRLYVVASIEGSMELFRSPMATINGVTQQLSWTRGEATFEFKLKCLRWGEESRKKFLSNQVLEISLYEWGNSTPIATAKIPYTRKTWPTEKDLEEGLKNPDNEQESDSSEDDGFDPEELALFAKQSFPLYEKESERKNRSGTINAVIVLKELGFCDATGNDDTLATLEEEAFATGTLDNVQSKEALYREYLANANFEPVLTERKQLRKENKVAFNENKGGVRMRETSDGKVYYTTETESGTQSSSWVDPKLSESLPQGWRATLSSVSGRIFYINDDTQETSWFPPGQSEAVDDSTKEVITTKPTDVQENNIYENTDE
eukprot:g4608.t1